MPNCFWLAIILSRILVFLFTAVPGGGSSAVASDSPAAPGDAKATLAERIKPWLERPLLVPQQTQEDVCALVESQTARLSPPADLATWQKSAEATRLATLDKVVFRGVPDMWRSADVRVERLGEVESGEGYRVVRLRYEALPGLWVPALLYEPVGIPGKLAVSLHVNGHDALGKAAPYKQIRCLNLAKRGVLALNVEWIGMGQFRVPGNAHGKLNQLDLCGVAGLAPFYLVMQRGLDVVLQHPQADPQRVAVAGLSGGGWQTIYLSALDPRVTLSNPVAGYSSFVTRVRHHSDLGDSEQTPNDMATVADYTHLTALRAPRPTLLTYNVKDDCCFASAHALPPLLDAAQPVFRLFGKEDNLRQHVNHDPGTHNFERDNRQAFYRMLADHGFAAEGRPFPREEIDMSGQVRKPEQLAVELPAENADLHRLAVQAAVGLPRTPAFPEAAVVDFEPWRKQRVERLREVMRVPGPSLLAQVVWDERVDDVRVRGWRMKSSDRWSFPLVEFERNDAEGTTLLVTQEGRATLAARVAELLDKRQRVVVIDPFYYGECECKQRGYLFALLVATVGQRPLGVQASQISLVARWLVTGKNRRGPLTLDVSGERLSVAALAATALDRHAFQEVHIRQGLGSLHEVLDRDLSYEQAPELFCFGLLADFDVVGLAALAAPTPVRWLSPTDRTRKELQPLRAWYERQTGKSFTPF